jgi:hypothetical protein
MNTEDFSKFPINDQAQYIWDNGVFIQFRDYYNPTLALYSVGRKFNEVWHRKAPGLIVKVTQPDLERVSKFYGREI